MCVCIVSADAVLAFSSGGLVGGVVTDYAVLWLIRCTTPCVMLSSV